MSKPWDESRDVTEALRANPDVDEDTARASRWLVVADDQTAELSRRVTGATVEQTPNYLTALAELAETSASVVIGPVSKLAGMAEATASSLRELAPDAKLIVTAHPHERDAADAALGAGFDRVLMLPTDAGKLAQAIVNETGEPARDDVELGDVDLVDAVLKGEGELPALAMRLVAGQSGVPGITLSHQREDVPQGHVCVDVVVEGKATGYLHAPKPALEAELRVWSGWLSRWLTLHERYEQFKHLSLKDELTGAWNRRYFNRFLHRILEWAARDRSQVTLLVFDIDDFKQYNDRHGHWAGDEILREAARLMMSVSREHDVVARIGGDEFAVIFWDAEAQRRPHSRHPQDVVRAAERFQKAICSHAFPKLLEGPGTLTISGGLASYPWDGRTPDELLARADEMAMASKRNGKNAITFGPGAAKVCKRIP